jgi:hypothetical protein
VLLGLDDAPGDLDGFGPIPAATARLIAQDATWQRLVTDPVTGVLTDYSTTTYQPGKVLRGAVEVRGPKNFGQLIPMILTRRYWPRARLLRLRSVCGNRAWSGAFWCCSVIRCSG